VLISQSQAKLVVDKRREVKEMSIGKRLSAIRKRLTRGWQYRLIWLFGALGLTAAFVALLYFGLWLAETIG